MFRFTIRDILWLTAVLAVGAAWWANRLQLRHETAAVQLQVERAAQELAMVKQKLAAAEVERETLANILGHMPGRIFPSPSN